MANFDQWVATELDKRKALSLLRNPDRPGRDVVQSEQLDFTSNDYLNLASDPGLVAALTESQRCGTGGSRVVSGTMVEHLELEQELAEFFVRQQALVFGSGYLANIGLLSAFIGRNDQVFADRYIHASLIDGIQLSRAKCERFIHNDLNSLETALISAQKARREKQKFFIITESVFSMDGDIAPLKAISELGTRFDATMIIDEAHAVGIFGEGRGVLAEENISETDSLLLGTLSKALGSYGGFCCLGSSQKELLASTARSFIYSTAPPGTLMRTASVALRFIRESPEVGRKVLKRAEKFRTMLQDAGFNTFHSASQIVPLLIGGTNKTLAIAKYLEEHQLRVLAVRSPTVPEGSERLRFSISLSHSEETLERAARLIIEAGRKFGVI